MSDIYYAIKCGSKFVGFKCKSHCYVFTYNLCDACTWRDRSLAEFARLTKVKIPSMSAKDKETGLRIVEIEVRG